MEHEVDNQIYGMQGEGEGEDSDSDFDSMLSNLAYIPSDVKPSNTIENQYEPTTNADAVYDIPNST